MVNLFNGKYFDRASTLWILLLNVHLVLPWTSSSRPIEHSSARAEALHRLYQRGKSSQACEIKTAQGTKSKFLKCRPAGFRVRQDDFFMRSNFYFMHWQFWVSPRGKFSVVQFSRLQKKQWMDAAMDAGNSFLGILWQADTDDARRACMRTDNILY